MSKSELIKFDIEFVKRKKTEERAKKMADIKLQLEVKKSIEKGENAILWFLITTVMDRKDPLFMKAFNKAIAEENRENLLNEWREKYYDEIEATQFLKELYGIHIK